MTEVRLSLKLGTLELECEGTENFVGTQLIDFVERISRIDIPDVVAAQAQERSLAPVLSLESPPSSLAKLSATDFAVKMGAKSGSDLVMAAAAYLHHTMRSEEFRRSDLLNQMKGAKAFYKASYGSNLSKSLEMLTKAGRLQNPRSDTFALPYAEIEATKRLL